jgi:hypothetical protein
MSQLAVAWQQTARTSEGKRHVSPSEPRSMRSSPPAHTRILGVLSMTQLADWCWKESGRHGKWHVSFVCTLAATITATTRLAKLVGACLLVDLCRLNVSHLAVWNGDGDGEGDGKCTCICLFCVGYPHFLLNILACSVRSQLPLSKIWNYQNCPT